jgi:predicted phosphodiesterase
MRIAILSDTHGDLVCLRAVIADLERQDGIDEVLLAGDLAQGGPQPAEVVDEIRGRGWRSARGNSDDLLVRIACGEALGDDVPAAVVAHGEWSAERLGAERIDHLASLPFALEVADLACGRLLVVHSTPWSNEEVVLPDAAEQVVLRVIEAAGARLVASGHIHTPYQRRLGDAVLLSAGAVTGSNDADPRPAYTIVDAGDAITVEVRRVECPAAGRLAAYERAGLELSDERRARLAAPGPFPVRSRPGVPVRLWP